jgi:hypothetical protein
MRYPMVRLEHRNEIFGSRQNAVTLDVPLTLTPLGMIPEARDDARAPCL